MPVVLTFLAPAQRCNQRCPRCILDLTGEPVRDTRLRPQDFGCFVSGFIRARVPIRIVTFQGYEVTLPESWPYVQSVFRTCQAHRIPRGFVTNGMLLHKRVKELVSFDPRRVSVSLDGSTPEVHDLIRGLTGAFDATLSSIRRLLQEAPAFRERLSVTSTLFGKTNLDSLRDLPPLLAQLGIPIWAVTIESTVAHGTQLPAHDAGQAARWFAELQEAAVAHGLRFYVSDELGHFRSAQAAHGRSVELKHVFDPAFLYRVEPSGHVRVGEELLQSWDASAARAWRPGRDDPVEVVGYWEAVRRHRAPSPPGG